MTSAAFSGNGYVHLNLYNFHQKEVSVQLFNR